MTFSDFGFSYNEPKPSLNLEKMDQKTNFVNLRIILFLLLITGS